MPPLDLGERLAVEIVVVAIHPSVPVDERAASTPSRQLGDEIIGGGQLDVDVQGLLGSGDRLEDSCRLRSTLGSTATVVSRQPKSTAELPLSR